jgi:hypothetical protein
VARVENFVDHLGFWERHCVKRALKINKRSRVLNHAMELVIGRKHYDANTMEQKYSFVNNQLRVSVERIKGHL